MIVLGSGVWALALSFELWVWEFRLGSGRKTWTLVSVLWVLGFGL